MAGHDSPEGTDRPVDIRNVGKHPRRTRRTRRVWLGTLTDPFNKGPFIYRLTGSMFLLYSRGKNNIDEHGKRDLDGSVDDWAIWPPREPSPARKPPDANGV